jgi:hypothetical protein
VNRILLTLTVVVVALNARAQQFSFEASHELRAVMMEADALNQVYLVDSSGIITRVNLDPFSLLRFNNNRFGLPSGIDASNPFKLLVHYPAHAVALLLDNQLTEVSQINFAALGFPLVPVIAQATDDGTWFYDAQENKIRKLDDALNPVMESERIELITGEVLQPVFMREHKGQLYLADTAKGIFVFDRFGAFARKLLITGVSAFQLMDDNLIYFTGSDLHFFHLPTFSEQIVPLPESANLVAVQLAGSRLMLLHANLLSLYTF